MRKRIFSLILLSLLLLAPTRPEQRKIYLPFVYWEPTFHSTCQGQISGTVYKDMNGNGYRDDNEVGLPSISLMLTSYQGGQTTTIITDHIGQYIIGLRRGRYVLQAEKPEGYRWTTPHIWGIDIECATIQLNFGLKPLPSQ